ncbi:MAG: carbohydrate porin, partial [Mariprofundales bacterium]
SSFGIAPDISANAAGVSIFPQAGWAVRLDYHFSDSLSLHGAIYDGDPTTRAVAANEGKMKIIEGIWGDGAQAYKLGGWQHSGNKTGPDGRLFASDSGVYAVVDQPLGGALAMFVQLGYAQQNRNDIGNYVGLGLHVSGMVLGREDDEFGIALARSGFSDLYRRINTSSPAETAVELTYQAQVFPWLVVHPAFQWIQHPGGNAALSAAKVGMIRASITLP